MDASKTTLHDAITNQRTDDVKRLLNEDPSLATLTDSEGRNALHLATVEGDVNLIKSVLQHVDLNSVDKDGHTALHWATVCGLCECVSFLVENGCNPAISDIHGACPIHYATQLCGEQSDKAAELGLKCLQILLRKGGSSINCVDSGGKTPLLWAATAGNSKACRLLADLKADRKAADTNGLTAVHCATCRQHAPCVETLLRDCRCDPNLPDNNGCTPLFYAVTMANLDCARTLLKYGGSPNWKDRFGKSPVFCAASIGSLPLLKLVHEYKGALQVRTATKDTPVTEAAKKGHVVARSVPSQGVTVFLPRYLKGKPYSSLDCAQEKASVECATYLISLGAKHGVEIPEELWHIGPNDIEDDIPEVDTPNQLETLNTEPNFQEGQVSLIEWEPASPITIHQQSWPNIDQDAWDLTSTKSLPVLKSTVKPKKTSSGKREQTTRTEAVSGDGGPSMQDTVNRERVGQAMTVKGRRHPERKNTNLDAVALERKLTNWSRYLQDNVEFLDVVINSQIPELSDARQKAIHQKEELVQRLDQLKVELHRNNKRASKDTDRKGEERSKQLQADIAVIRRLQDIKEMFERATASAAKSLDEFLAKQPSPRRKQRPYNQDDNDGDDTSQEEISKWNSYNNYHQRRQKHKAWMKKNNGDYTDQKKYLQSYCSRRPVVEHANDESPTDQSGMFATSQNISVISPYNAKVILPLRLQEPRQRHRRPSSNEAQWTSYEEAQIRRRIGELNRASSSTSLMNRVKEWHDL